MSNWNRNRRRKKVAFNPNSSYIKNAVEDFLKKGGSIKRIEPDEESFRRSLLIKEGSGLADDFLKGD